MRAGCRAGAGVIYRAFGAADAQAEAQAARRAAPPPAAWCSWSAPTPAWPRRSGADGVHLPERA